MSPLSQPPETPAQRLVVAITARALFDLEDSHALFQSSGLDAYAEFQRSREKEVLAPGIAFPLVQKLLALNTGAPPEAPRVEVVLLSRNSSDTGLRIFNSIRHYGLGIVRAVFTSGAEVWPYIRPFGAQLFLSANPDSVRSALEHGVAAATILPSKAPEHRHDQLRIAFDGDAVIFGDESERVSQQDGLAAFHHNEASRAGEPLSGGPFRGFLAALHEL
ncbi:MAG: 5'-nucleotidase, partial [Arenimonas sp.]|nr:5'-nucleotidase [Arenimonas sp.]